MRFFFHIAYLGTNYRGWQRQQTVPTIQETIEQQLSRILKAKVTCIGCGRTDAEVHASQYFFHIDVREAWGIDLLFVLNKSLPNDIAILDILPMEGRPHAQFDVEERTYDYFLHHSKDPFLHQHSTQHPLRGLQIEPIREALDLLLKYRDYRFLCKVPDRHDHTNCQISTAELLIIKPGERLRFRFTADRFLQGMIRILVTKLLQIGHGELRVAQFERYLQLKDRPHFLNPAYPQGLYLSKVVYPFLNIAPKVEAGSNVTKVG